MTTVILDGAYAGMTEQEYDEARAIDCKIARHLGWYPVDSHEQLWSSLCTGQDGVYRDDPDGVPFYQADISSAFPLMRHALTVWRYAAQQIFFVELQRRGSETNLVEWPDVLTSLIFDMPEHICGAFVASIEWFEAHNFDPCGPSKAAALYGEHVGMETIKEKQEDGSEKVMRRAKLPPGIPPWVH